MTSTKRSIVAAAAAASAKTAAADILASLPDLRSQHVLLAVSARHHDSEASRVLALYDAIAAQRPKTLVGGVVAAIGTAAKLNNRVHLRRGVLVAVLDPNHWDVTSFLCADDAQADHVRTKPIGRWPSQLRSTPTPNATTSLRDMQSISRAAVASQASLRFHPIPPGFECNDGDNDPTISSTNQQTPSLPRENNPTAWIQSLHDQGYNRFLAFTDKDNTALLDVVDSALGSRSAAFHGLVAADTPFLTGTPACLFSGAGILPRGAVGIALRRKTISLTSSKDEIPIVVARHPRLTPMGNILEISRCTGNVITELSGSSPADQLRALTASSKPVSGIASKDQLWARIFRSDNEPQAKCSLSDGKVIDGAVYQVATGDVSRGMLALGDLLADLQPGMKLQFLRHLGTIPIEDMTLNDDCNDELTGNDGMSLTLACIGTDAQGLIDDDDPDARTNNVSEIALGSEYGVFSNTPPKNGTNNNQRPNDPVSGAIMVITPYSSIKSSILN